MGFKRGFAGEASADYTLIKGANGIYEAFTYAAQYSSGSGEPDRSTLLFIVSDPKNISLENVAATFKYPEARSSNLATTMITEIGLIGLLSSTILAF